MATVVLVHGAWSDGSIWADVIANLQRHGHDAYAVELPATSLADDIAETRRQLDLVDGPVTLVGHSSGGMVVSGAGLRHAKVASLVFVAGYVPDAGESLLSLTDRGARMPGAESIRFSQDGWSTIDPHRFRAALGADVPASTAQTLAAAQRPTHGACFTANAARGAWHDIPSTYVLSTADRILDPTLQRWFATRAGATVVELASSHLSPVSQPGDVAAAIRQALPDAC